MPKISEQKRRDTRDAIIQAAENLFSLHGYHNTQVMDIIKTVGMSAGTFYNHFKDKRDLFGQIMADNFTDLRIKIKKTREPLNIWDQVDRRQKLFETFCAYFDYLESHRNQIIILLRGAFGVDQDMDTSIWKYHSGLIEDLSKDIRNWLDIGIIEGIQPDPMSYAIIGMAMHLGHSYLMGQALSREEAVEAMVSVCMSIFDSHMTEVGRKALQGGNKA